MSNSNDGEGVPDLAPIPRKRVVAYRRATMRPPVREQVAGRLHDLAVSFAALRLAATAAETEEDDLGRDQALQQALSILARAGSGHVSGLVAAALAYEVDPAPLTSGAGSLQ